MIPSVGEHLEAIRARLAETIFPALPAEAGFAREQATFVLMALDLLQATHQHEYRYEVVECHEYVAAVERLVALCRDGGAGAAVREAEAVLAHRRPHVDEARLALPELVAANRELKATLAHLFTHLCAVGGAAADRARDVVHALGVAQVARERALFATTGFTESGSSLGELLGETPSSPRPN